MAEVHCDAISKRVGTTEIIPDLTLTVRDGEFFILLGPSGSGKSTLLQLIAGLDQPSGGRILFDTQDITGLTPQDRDIAMVFQAYALYPHMTVAENLAFPLRVGRRRRIMDRRMIGEEVDRVAKLLGLRPLLDRQPRELSGGQRQRVALGRAIIRRPRVFLLDEPLSNLDAQLRSDMRAELRRLHDELGITMIYVTHDQTEAMTLADRVALLDRGRIQQLGRPYELYEAPENLFVAGFIGHPSMNIWAASIHDGHAVVGAFRIPVPPEITRRFGGVRLQVGIRPEDMRVWGQMRESPRPGTSADGRVRLVEPTGSQTWVTCDVSMTGRNPAVRMVGLADRRFELKPGESALLSISKATAHLFDADTGLRVASVSLAETRSREDVREV